MPEPFYAHSLPDPNRPRSDWERLDHHLYAVASLAAGFAEAFAAADWGRVAGLWHDLGKYQAEFQQRLTDSSIHAPHAGVGAACAQARFGKAGLPLAFVIAGHHAGLANLTQSDAGRTPLEEVVRENLPILKRLEGVIPPSLSALPNPEIPAFLRNRPETREGLVRSICFFIRMLFSALVDADRLATAGFYARTEGRTPEAELLEYDNLVVLRDRLDAHIDRLSAKAATGALSPVNAMRAAVLDACRRAAPLAPGLFSLTVPTGGGKTLSSMSFALRHAVEYNLRRVIVVIPFTSIIEQNAKRYRDALGVDDRPDNRNVLEHHSGVDEEQRLQENSEAERRRQTAAENWDAPIVVTTTVQFFESLFSDHPSRCRKLHRIARSVIILDEVQTLPPRFLLSILDALRELSANYGCTIVLSTATPPALEKHAALPQGLTDVRPIIPDSRTLFDSPAARRVEVEWRTEQVTPYVELAREMAGHRQTLAIVHRRADARALYEQLPPEGRYHLSALMCPAHRLQRLEETTAALLAGGTCRLVATQLIEAGVDVDFPVVYRALAGLDSLAQAAGRCDREGRLTERMGRPGGKFIVFRAETPPPPGTLRKAQEATSLLLRLQQDMPSLAGGLDLYNPDHGLLFFRELYGREALDAANVQRELAAFNLASAAAAFRLIDDKFACPIVVPWGDAPQRLDAFRHQPNRSTIRALQPFIVQVRLDFAQHLADIGAIELWEDSLGLPTSLFGESRYTDEYGLDVGRDKGLDPDVLIC
jgi:CRISPR-associated endonuclease/helicase Cas3